MKVKLIREIRVDGKAIKIKDKSGKPKTVTISETDGFSKSFLMGLIHNKQGVVVADKPKAETATAKKDGEKR